MTISSKIDGDFLVEENMHINGMVTGDIIVSQHCTLIFSGMGCKNLIVEQNASVEINGTVAKNVYNRGGTLKIFGTVSGNVYKQLGDTFIDSEAVIKGSIFESGIDTNDKTKGNKADL